MDLRPGLTKLQTSLHRWNSKDLVFLAKESGTDRPRQTPVVKLGGMSQILDWVKEFCTKTGASGQLCFDFMRDTNDGRMYAFECNPRTSTILLNFYSHDHVAQAFFNAKVFPTDLPGCVAKS